MTPDVSKAIRAAAICEVVNALTSAPKTAAELRKLRAEWLRLADVLDGGGNGP